MNDIARDASATKRKRIQKMHSMLEGAGSVDYDRFIAVIEYQLGLSSNKAEEYLEVLETLDFIELDKEANLILEVTPEENSSEESKG